MDPVVNLQRQQDLAREIIELMDLPLGTVDGFLDEASRNEAVTDLANELAELVQALHTWRRSGGFDPYQAVNN